MTKTSLRRPLALGTIFIIIGTFLLLQNLNILPFYIPFYLFSWKTILIGIGVFALIEGKIFKGLLMMGIGCYFLLPSILQLPYNEYHLLWPGLIILLGIHLIRGRSMNEGRRYYEPKDINSNNMESTVVFGGASKKIISQEFIGGKLTAIFGGQEIDLTQCDIKENVYIEVSIICGGMTLIIPKEWHVINEAEIILAGIEDKMRYNIERANSPGIVLRGRIIMGGIEINRV